MKTKLLSLCLCISSLAMAQEPLYDYIFFANSRMTGNYFYSQSKSTGLSTIKNLESKLPVSNTRFFTPGNSIVLEYTNGAKGNWEAIIYKPEYRGQDHFKTANFLSFHAFSASVNNKTNLPSIQLMLRDSSLTKKVQFTIDAINKWKTVILPMQLFETNIQDDPSQIIGVVFSQQSTDGMKHMLYLDDIEFSSAKNAPVIKTKPVISGLKGFAKHVDLQWQPLKDSTIKYVKIYRSADGKVYKPVGIQSSSINRYADFTGETGKSYQYKISFLNHNYFESNLSLPVSVKTKSMNDEELLTMVQEATFRYYWEGAEKHSGLAKENILGRHDMIASGASGFGIMALIVGMERKFITREEGITRFTQIVNFLEKAETFHGAYAHFINGTTGKAEPFFGKRVNGGDLVETSFLVQGLLAARAFFNGGSNEEKIKFH